MKNGTLRFTKRRVDEEGRRGQGKGIPRVIAISSGKGGVGKTNIVVNLALQLSRMKQRVMVLDADLEMANVPLLLGLEAKWDLSHLLDGSKRLEEIVIDGPFKIFPARSTMDGPAHLSTPQKIELLEQIGRYGEPLDYLLIDTGAGLDDTVVYFNIAAHERVIVTSPEPPALSKSYEMMRFLWETHRETNFRLLVNQTATLKEGLEVYAELSERTDRSLGISLDYIGCILADAHVPQAVRRRRTVVECFPHASFSDCIRLVARRLVESTPPRLTGNIQFFWEQIVEHATHASSPAP